MSVTDENNFSELRIKAEEKLKGAKTKSKTDSLLDIEHELHVHEIELEMQNEELKGTQLKLVKSLIDYTELFDLAPIAYFILDDNGIIKNVNAKGGMLLGVGKKQLTGKPFSIFLKDEISQDNYYRHRNLVIETNEMKTLISDIKIEDGSTISILIENISVNDEKGHFKHILSNVTDISRQILNERKVELALEKEQELNEMKTHFITMTSHEFRTPLSTILSSAELIKNYNKTVDKTKREKHLDKIKFSVEKLREKLTEFYIINQLEQNLLYNTPETIDLVELIKDTILITDAMGHQLVYEPTEEYQEVYLDIKLLKICLLNLLSYAVTCSPNKEVIEISSDKNKSGDIQISIKYKGIGKTENIKSHFMGQILNSQDIDLMKGGGFNYNMLQKIITLMEGNVSFESNKKQGTSFLMKF